MATATATLFHKLAQRGYEPSLQNINGTVRFDIIDEGSWWVTVNEGALAVALDGEHVDCVYRTAAEDFIPIAHGELNPFAAGLQGRVELSGDPALALVMLRMFR